MKIVCVSDLHGDMPELPEGDLLIIAGDCTGWDRPGDWIAFSLWIRGLSFEKKIIIAGNHDNYLLTESNKDGWENLGVTYLEDSGTEYCGLKIWGSPRTVKFTGQNPEWAAFSEETDTDIKSYFSLIPKDTDIIITHCPPYDILDRVEKYGSTRKVLIRTGSPSLREVSYDVKPMLHVFGHIHAGYGMFEDNGTVFINASRMDEDYEPENPPWIVDLEEIQDLGNPACQVTQLFKNRSDN